MYIIPIYNERDSMKLELGMLGIYLPWNELCYISSIDEEYNDVRVNFLKPHYINEGGKEHSYFEQEPETLSNWQEWFKPSDYEILDFLRDVKEVIEDD